MRELAGGDAAQSLVVVTHGGVLDVVYRIATGLPIEAPRDYPIGNAGMNWGVRRRRAMDD